jgi:hypothetical protein
MELTLHFLGFNPFNDIIEAFVHHFDIEEATLNRVSQHKTQDCRAVMMNISLIHYFVCEKDFFLLKAKQ